MHLITHGGKLGHLLRRLIHIAMFFIAPLYFSYLYKLTWLMHLITPRQLVIMVMLALLLFEFLRIQQGWLLFGQRHRERNFISSFAQGALALGLVLLLSPGGYSHGLRYAWPLIAVLALVDPLMGELRQLKFAPPLVFALGWLASSLLWLAAMLHFALPLSMVLVLPAVSVLAEWPNLKWLDDNASMLIFPLLVVWLLV